MAPLPPTPPVLSLAQVCFASTCLASPPKRNSLRRLKAGERGEARYAGGPLNPPTHPCLIWQGDYSPTSSELNQFGEAVCGGGGLAEGLGSFVWAELEP